MKSILTWKTTALSRCVWGGCLMDLDNPPCACSVICLIRGSLLLECSGVHPPFMVDCGTSDCRQVIPLPPQQLEDGAPHVRKCWL